MSIRFMVYFCEVCLNCVGFGKLMCFVCWCFVFVELQWCVYCIWCVFEWCSLLVEGVFMFKVYWLVCDEVVEYVCV